MKIFLKPRSVFDGTGRDPILSGVVEIEGSTIATVYEDSAAAEYRIRSLPPDTIRVVDMPDCTLLPGFVNAHEHLDDRRSFGTFAERVSRPAPLLLLEGVRNCLASLREGITSVRDLGSHECNSLWLKRAINNGIIVGPRIMSCGQPLSITGGHGSPRSIEVDGPWEVIRAVRKLVQKGADIIKFVASGGRAEKRPSTQFTPEELEAGVRAAQQYGKSTTVHAQLPDAIRMAVLADVDCVEHALHLDSESARLMAEKGVWLVPTLSSVAVMAERGLEYGRRQEQVESARRALERLLDGFTQALSAGVRMAVGLDVMGMLALEMGLMVKGGMSPKEVLLAGTRNGAELMGLENQIGTIQSERLADLVGVRGDPLTRVEAVANVELIVVGGRIWTSDELDRLIGAQVRQWTEEHGHAYVRTG